MHSAHGTRVAVTIKSGFRQNVVMFVDIIDSMTIIFMFFVRLEFAFRRICKRRRTRCACIHTVIHSN